MLADFPKLNEMRRCDDPLANEAVVARMKIPKHARLE
jgi:hypothetical protein